MQRGLAVVLAVGLALAGPGEASEKQETCAQNTAIMQSLIDMRKSGVRERKAVARLTEGDDAVDPKYRIAVVQFAGWVYSQPRRDTRLFDADAFMAQCLAL